MDFTQLWIAVYHQAQWQTRILGECRTPETCGVCHVCQRAYCQDAHNPYREGNGDPHV